MPFQPEQPESPAPVPLQIRQQRRGRAAFLFALVLLVAAWAALMLFRWEVRAQWWAWQLTQAESKQQRDFYVTQLASIRDKSLGALPRVLKDPRPEVRETAATILRFCQSPQSTDLLVSMLGDEVPDVASLAATALAWRPDSAQHVPRLRQALHARQDDSAWGVVVALGRIGGPDAAATLRDALTRPCSPDIKAQLIDSLGLLGDRQAIPLIQQTLNDCRPVRIPPHSQLSAQRAIQALQSDLRARGTDPEDAMLSASIGPTVAGVAAHWLKLLGENPSPATAAQATAPASGHP